MKHSLIPTTRSILRMTLSLILLTCILPVIITTFYGIPSADDFSNTLPYLTFAKNKLLFPFWNTANLYQNWQGNYWGCFLASLPVYHLWGLNGLHLEMFLNAIFFFSSIYIFIKTLLKIIIIKKNELFTISLLFMTLSVFYLLHTDNLSEIFYWHTGLSVYTLPLSFSFLAFSCYLKYTQESPKTKYLVIGSLCAFFSAGGALNVSAFLCATLLLFTLYDFIIVQSLKLNIFIGLSALLGSIINAIAPGNFARHSAIDSEIRVIDSIISTILRTNDVIFSEDNFKLLLVIIIITFVVSYKTLTNSNFNFKYPVLIMFYCYLSIHITDFPVVLGYSSSKLPARCAFIESASIIIFVMISTVYWGGWAASKQLFRFSKEWIFSLSLLCIIMLSGYFNFSNLLKLTPYKMTYDLVQGNYSIELQNYKEIIHQLETSAEEDVIINLPNPTTETNLKKIGLSDDATWWVNSAVANYFNKDSVVLRYANE